MRLRFVGHDHLLVYQGGGVDPWPSGEVREVDSEIGAYLLGRGDFESADPEQPPRVAEGLPPAPAPAPEKPKRARKG